MKCKNCGADIEQDILGCTFCGVRLMSGLSNLSTTKIESENICAFYCKKYVNSNGDKIIESVKICKNENEWESPFFTISFVNQKHFYLYLYISVSEHQFTYDNYFREIDLEINFSETETISFKVQYSKCTEDNRVDKKLYTKRLLVEYKLDFAENLISKILNTSSTLFKIKSINNSKERCSIIIDNEVKLLIDGFYSCLKNNIIERGATYDLASQKLKDKFLIDNRLFSNIKKHNELYEKYRNLTFEDFKIWCENNKEKFNSYKTFEINEINKNLLNVKNLKEELNTNENKLRKWELNNETRIGFSAFSSLAILIFFWIKFNIKIGLIVVSIYIVCFFAYSKLKTFQLNQRIKELEKK
jgi:hypothetical protein